MKNLRELQRTQNLDIIFLNLKAKSIMRNNYCFTHFGPRVYPKGSLVIALVCVCVSVCPSVCLSLNISETAH